jgi:glycosyltransferase 2 family protein
MNSIISNTIDKYRGHPFGMKLVKAISFTIVILIFIFVFLKVSDDWSSIHWDTIQIKYMFILPALLIAIISNLLICYIWKRILCLFRINMPFLASFRIQLISQIGKYIPGKIGLLFTKMIECNKVGISNKISMLSASYEIGLGLYFQLLVGAVTIPFFLPFFSNSIKTVSIKSFIILIPLGFVFVHPYFFLSFTNLFFKIINKKTIHMNIKFFNWFILILSFLSLAFLNGLLGFFVINMFYAVSFDNIFYIIGTTSWAFLLGLLSIFAPSGIGVRDGILVGFYSYLMPAPLALAVAIIIRILATSVEWSLIGVAFLIKPNKIKIEE